MYKTIVESAISYLVPKIDKRVSTELAGIHSYIVHLPYHGLMPSKMITAKTIALREYILGSWCGGGGDSDIIHLAIWNDYSCEIGITWNCVQHVTFWLFNENFSLSLFLYFHLNCNCIYVCVYAQMQSHRAKKVILVGTFFFYIVAVVVVWCCVRHSMNCG